VSLVWLNEPMEELQASFPANELHFLPEPERRTRYYPIISVDDHIVEPPDIFEGRVPTRFAERAPRVIQTDSGYDTWLYDGQLLPNIGLNAVVGRPPSEYSREPASFNEMRRGSWDIHHRIADMDIDGVFASLNFPSFLPGFGGGRIQTITEDRELALAVVRAWNDWHVEEWAGACPERIIPCQITWLHDPRLAADEIRANALRGFRAVSFPEAPENLGLPSLHTDYWDDLWIACQETETVVCLHTGSGGILPTTSSDAPREATALLFGLVAVFPAADWLFSLVPVRFPDLKIVLAESGIGWVSGMLDRLDHISTYHECYGDWRGTDLSPSEVLRRNFWFCAVDNPSSMKDISHIGPANVLCEVDYPHADSSWPNSQSSLKRHVAGLDDDVIERIAWRNASELFRHPVPDSVLFDPESF
jgi:predicted TIM-barrel fold metal-dependent hydrolase